MVFLLLLSSLTSCLCGLELNVAHTSYQAEEEQQSVTLDWTFTPRPDPSMKDLFVFCYKVSNDDKLSVLIDFQEGVVHSESQSEEFSGRVQFDKDLLREGRIRLNVSSLRTQDSGEYWCWVKMSTESKSDRCRLNVTAARDQTHSKPGPDRNQTHSKPGAYRDQTHSNPGPEEPDSGSRGWIGLYCGLGLTAAVLVVVLVLKFRCWLKKLSMKFDETDPEKSLSELRMNTFTSVSSER